MNIEVIIQGILISILSESIKRVINYFERRQEYKEIITLLKNALEEDVNAAIESMDRIYEHAKSLNNAASRLDTYVQLPTNKEIPKVLSDLVDEITSYIASLYRFLDVLGYIRRQEAFMNRLKNTSKLSHIYDLIKIVSQSKDEQKNYRILDDLIVWLKMHNKSFFTEIEKTNVKNTIENEFNGLKKLVNFSFKIRKDRRLLNKLNKNWKQIIGKNRLKRFADAVKSIQADFNVKEYNENFTISIVSPLIDFITTIVFSLIDIED